MISPCRPTRGRCRWRSKSGWSRPICGPAPARTTTPPSASRWDDRSRCGRSTSADGVPSVPSRGVSAGFALPTSMTRRRSSLQRDPLSAKREPACVSSSPMVPWPASARSSTIFAMSPRYASRQGSGCACSSACASTAAGMPACGHGSSPRRESSVGCGPPILPRRQHSVSWPSMRAWRRPVAVGTAVAMWAR